MRSRIDSEPRANQAVQQHQRETQKSVDEQHLLTVILRGSTQLSLHLTLITAVVGHVKKKATDQHGQKGKIVAVTEPVMPK